MTHYVSQEIYNASRRVLVREQIDDQSCSPARDAGEDTPVAVVKQTPGRHDTRQRSRRGHLRTVTVSQLQPQEQSISHGTLPQFCYKVPVAHLPFSLRAELPRWARCGIEQAEDNTTTRSELPRRTRYCYMQSLTLGETGELVEWKPESSSVVPNCYRVAVTPDELSAAPFIAVDQQEAQALVRELVNAAAPSPLIRVAPTYFLTEEMRAMIAPEVSFPDEGNSLMPVSSVFYFYPTGTTYDDEQLGRLYLVHAALFVDRLNGCRSGPVETLWLTRKQIGQSLIWERELERLDTHELRVRVNAHAVARGATPPSVVSPDERGWQRRQEEHEQEEQYNLVPLKDEVFVSEADLNDGYRRGEALAKTVLRVMERYLEHPQEQPLAYRLEYAQLTRMRYWLKQDRRRQFTELPHPAKPTIIKHPVLVVTRQQEWNEQASKIGSKDVTELIGYRLIVGVMATTPVPRALIVEPRRDKPIFQAPTRPIQPCRTPNYVPLANVA